MKRDIIEIDDLLLIEAEHVAAQNDVTLSEAIALALRAWVDANRKPNRLSFAGIFEGDGSSSDPEELDRQLRAGLHPHEGWSPSRAGLSAKDVREKLP
jgi:hypothetical protein